MSPDAKIRDMHFFFTSAGEAVLPGFQCAFGGSQFQETPTAQYALLHHVRERDIRLPPFQLQLLGTLKLACMRKKNEQNRLQIGLYRAMQTFITAMCRARGHILEAQQRRGRRASKIR